jgi:hypothetical protein
MPGTIVFLANATDPTDPLTTFGKGHVTDFDAEDEAWVKILLSEGKAALLSTDDVAATAAERQRFAEYLEPPHVWPGLKKSTTG